MTGLWSVIRCMKGAAKCRSYSTLIYTILLLFYVASLNAAAPNNSINKNKVTTVKECQKFLCKYEYMKKICECHIQLKRHKRSLFDDLLPLEYPSENTHHRPQEGAADVLDMSDNDTILTGTCNDSDFIVAFRVFQKNFRLPITGVCDVRTQHQMSQPRCGQPDTELSTSSNVPPTSENGGDQQSNRRSRSLRDVLAVPQSSKQNAERRREQLQSYLEEIRREEITPKKLHEYAQQKHKRSTLATSVNDYDGILSQRKITWRLMSQYRTGDGAAQRSILRQAFAYWSEVLPLCFEEKDADPTADIEIGFLEGAHLTCFRQFDGSGGEIAHKYFRDVHFDNSEQYYMTLTEGSRGDLDHLTPSSLFNGSVSLLLAATHELGHVIGLNHSTSTKSIMNPVYHDQLDNSFELSSFDRNMALNAYGPCKGTFDTVFDYVRLVNESRVFNTHFFRDGIYWMYENQMGRPRANFPQPITRWDIVDVDGSQALITKDVDGFLHYFDVRFNPSSVVDEHFFFRGDKYFMYDPEAEEDSDKIQESGLISSKFRAGRYSLPNSIDAVFFDYRDKITYFFKGEYVYLYKYTPGTTHSCCESKELIVTVFPPQSPPMRNSSTGNSYSSDIDSVYYSWHRSALFFIKGEDVWENVNYRIQGRKRDNAMVYRGKWWDTWKFICDINCES